MMKDAPLKLCLFYCSNSLDATALRQSAIEIVADELTTVSLPCSGKVNLLYLLKAFEKGADGVLLVTCGQGKCQFLEGNLRARKRSEAVDAILEEIGLGKGRMRLIPNNNEGDAQQIIEEIKSLSNMIRGQS
jgi:F420-non-reducing hydrogenase iron-sulfur subunit